jgi:hypothetical protein
VAIYETCKQVTVQIVFRYAIELGGYRRHTFITWVSRRCSRCYAEHGRRDFRRGTAPGERVCPMRSSMRYPTAGRSSWASEAGQRGD